jgi:hypothetical protein
VGEHGAGPLKSLEKFPRHPPRSLEQCASPRGSERAMPFAVAEAVEVLAATPSVVSSLLSPLSEVWLRADEGEGTFTPLDVVGHLIHGERADWIVRLQCILEHGTERAFEPFDRFAHRRTEQGKDLEALLTTLRELRAANLELLRRVPLSAADLERQGRHPDFGVVTVRQLLATWVAHDLTHISQICRVMARRYAEEVGPWRAYLRILRPM